MDTWKNVAESTVSSAEVKYQIQNTGAKIMLVDPTLLDTALGAAKEAGFPIDHMFLFDDTERPNMHGIRDWRTILGSEKEAETWRWRSLSSEQARTKTAVLNYSSGYVASVITEQERLT